MIDGTSVRKTGKQHISTESIHYQIHEARGQLTISLRIGKTDT